MNKSENTQNRIKKFFNPLNERVDTLIIGGGISGLVCGALLAKQKIPTLVAEQALTPGGFFSYFAEGDYIFDYAVSYLLSCGADGEMLKFLNETGIDNKVHFQKLENLDFFVFPDKEEFVIPADVNSFEQKLCIRFPHEKENIVRYFNWMKEFDSGLNIAANKGKRSLPPAIVITNFLKNYEPFIKSYFTDQRLMTLLSIRTHADPSSLMIMAGFLNECFLRGMYYHQGGSHLIPIILGEAILEQGGNLALNKCVTALQYIHGNDYPYQVSFKSGEIVYAKHIVSDISPFHIVEFFKKGGKYDGLENAIAKLETVIAKRSIGHSSFNIYLAVRDIDITRFNCGRIYLLPDNIDEEDVFKLYTKIEHGVLVYDTVLKVHIPSFYDSTLAPPGISIIRIETDMLIEPFQTAGPELKENLCTAFLEKVEQKLLPGLRNKIVFQRVITPLEWESLTLNYKGSGTGWAHTVDNYIKNVFPTNMGIPGLYTIGQWGELGTGLRQGILSAGKVKSGICL